MTTIHCRCGIEVGLVRLNSETLVFGHKTNPRNNRHPVRLSRSVTASPLGSGDGSLSEASDTRRENANAGASPTQRTIGTRSASDGRSTEPHRHSGQPVSGITPVLRESARPSRTPRHEVLTSVDVRRADSPSAGRAT